MSTAPENEFDLEKLFLPAWAQEEPSSAKYAQYEGEEARPERRERRGPRPPRREGPGGRREGGRPPGEGRRPGRGDRHAHKPGEERPQRGAHPGGRRGEPRERREPPAPLPELNVTLVPEEKGVESLARQIKISGRAFPLFDIAQMILQKPERHSVVFSIKKNAEGKPVQALFVCALDDSLWLSEDEAIGHVLRKHFGTFYQAEKTATEPPKGKYTFVAQCGMSGTILGPPNYHDYQNQLRKLHAERFSRMPFEVYKARVKIVRDEAVVKKWVEDQSWKTEYLCLNMPEPVRLPNMEAVEKHFREHHKDNIIKPVESHTLNGTAARALRSHELTRFVRSVWEDQRRFPLQIATVLSQQFAGHGLQFFKVNKSITHVSVARPHYLDLALTPVSEGVKRIVEYINANPKCTRRPLLQSLAPAPAPAPIPVPVAAVPAATEPGAPPQTSEPPRETAAPPQTIELTPEQNALNADLHWLIHQGHVIEFANGMLETAKKPVPRPPKPPKAPATPAEGTPQSAEATSSGELAPTASAEGAPESQSTLPAAETPPAGELESSAALAPAPEQTPETGAEPASASDTKSEASPAENSSSAPASNGPEQSDSHSPVKDEAPVGMPLPPVIS